MKDRGVLGCTFSAAKRLPAVTSQHLLLAPWLWPWRCAPRTPPIPGQRAADPRMPESDAQEFRLADEVANTGSFASGGWLFELSLGVAHSDKGFI